jgi:hypothetical protein
MADKNQFDGESEEINRENTQNGGDISNNNNTDSVEESENPEREITQTDHLNKRLLSAFLDKLNDKGADNSNTLVEEEDSWEEEQPGH